MNTMTDDTDQTPHAPYGATDDEPDRSGEASPHGPYGVPTDEE